MFRRNKIRQTPVRRAVSLFNLLAQKMERRQHLAARFVGVKLHVVAHPVRREKTVNTVRLDQFLADDLLQQLLRVGKQFARLLAVFLMLKNLGITPRNSQVWKNGDQSMNGTRSANERVENDVSSAHRPVLVGDASRLSDRREPAHR